ncbi:MAG TPA: hypothetical protein VHK69_21435 [Chitinophagaceae bacterium]|jgi:hypothetical protein|nr:hypothetical protein [Chitinophagaceae bacterium]
MKCVPLILLLSLLGGAGCQSQRRISIRNVSGADACITWKIKEDSVNASPFFISLSDSTTLTLRSRPPHHLMKMSFGTGSWTPSYLQAVSNDLDLLEIRYRAGLIRLEHPDSIAAFLLPRRRSIDKSQIRIVLR